MDAYSMLTSHDMMLSLAHMDRKEILNFHRHALGKIKLHLTQPLKTRGDLAMTYTPGVAVPAKEIAENQEKVWSYTGRKNRVAIISDGSAVLGLGNVGPEAALPVMEGKAALFKEFADVDAFPIVLATQNVEEIIMTVKSLAPSFGGILLEDISAPRCFSVEESLKRTLDIPVFHDDQHGTAIVVLAALMNALRVTGRSGTSLPARTCVRTGRRDVQRGRIADSATSAGSPSALDERSIAFSSEARHRSVVPQITLSGAGAAGTAITRMLLSQGFKNITVCDSKGIINRNRSDLKYVHKTFIAAATNPQNLDGNLADAIKGSDVFIGVSKPNLVTKEMIQSMAPDPIIFALANPDPEIMPADAKEAGAAVVASGRSDQPNQVNNLLAFPGIFRGALDMGAKEITEEMKLAAAHALAECVEEPTAERILPDPLEKGITKKIAQVISSFATTPQQTCSRL